MSLVTPMQAANRPIDGLPGKQHDRNLQCSEAVDLFIDGTLYEPGQALRYLFFPLSGVIALVTTLVGHPLLELGRIGAILALGVGTAPMRALRIVWAMGAGLAVRRGGGFTASLNGGFL